LVTGSAVNQVHHEVYTTPPTCCELTLALTRSLKAKLAPSTLQVTGSAVVGIRLEVHTQVSTGLFGGTSTLPIDTGQVVFTEGTFICFTVTVVVLVVADFFSRHTCAGVPRVSLQTGFPHGAVGV